MKKANKLLFLPLITYGYDCPFSPKDKRLFKMVIGSNVPIDCHILLVYNLYHTLKCEPYKYGIPSYKFNNGEMNLH